MSNSSLICYTKISPNCTKPRNKKIDSIVVHHMAGNCSIETCGEIFSRPARQCSSNYGIGTDGRIALYCDEANRSWCSSSGTIDHRAITIEVANDGGSPNWHVSDKAFESLVALCTDICKRNGIAKLNYTGDKTGNLHMHKWYAATGCPGPYLGSKFPELAERVNKNLGVSTTSTSATKTTTTTKAATTTTAKEACPYSEPNYVMTTALYKNKSVDGVKWLQWHLTKLGLYTDKIDGYFGPVTVKSVSSFQSTHKDAYGRALSVDGMCGPLTRTAIKTAYANLGTTSTSSSSSTTKTSTTFKVGDKVRLISGAKYANGGTIPNWVINTNPLYVRVAPDSNGNCSFSIKSTGACTGRVNIKYLTKI